MYANISKNSQTSEELPSSAEIRNYAEHLGMDIKNDEYFFYIAKSALMAPLPKNWNKIKENDGSIKYYNSITKETTATHPMDNIYKQHYKELKTIRNQKDIRNIENSNNKNIFLEDGDVKKTHDFKGNIENNDKENKIINSNKQKTHRRNDQINEEILKVKKIRETEFEERKRNLILRKKNLDLKKAAILKNNEQVIKKQENILENEKFGIQEKFQDKINTMHMKLMSIFTENIRFDLNEFENLLLQKKREIIDRKKNEKIRSLVDFYGELFQKEINQMKTDYEFQLAEYKRNQEKQIENEILNEFHLEKSRLLQNQINQINKERLEIEEKYRRKMQKIKIAETEKSAKELEINKINEEIHLLREKIQITPQEIDETLLIFDKKLSTLDENIYKISDENKLLQIELASLNNQLNSSASSNDEFSQINEENFQKESSNIIFLNKTKEEKTILKQENQDNSKDVSFGDTTLQKTHLDVNESSINLSNIEKNCNSLGFVKAPLKLLKKRKDLKESSPIYVNNEKNDSYLSEIKGQELDISLNKTNKTEIIGRKTINAKKPNKREPRDWNIVLNLEKDKLQLLHENLEKDKLIFENARKKFQQKNQWKEELKKIQAKEDKIQVMQDAFTNLEAKFIKKCSENELEKDYEIYKNCQKNNDQIFDKNNSLPHYNNINNKFELFSNNLDELEDKSKESIGNISLQNMNISNNYSFFVLDKVKRNSKSKINRNLSFDLQNKTHNLFSSKYSFSCKERIKNFRKDKEKYHSFYYQQWNWLDNLKVQLSSNNFSKHYASSTKNIFSNLANK